MNAPSLIELHKKLRLKYGQAETNADFWRFAHACVKHLPRIITDYDARISELTAGVVERLGEEE